MIMMNRDITFCIQDKYSLKSTCQRYDQLKEGNEIRWYMSIENHGEKCGMYINNNIYEDEKNY